MAKLENAPYRCYYLSDKKLVACFQQKATSEYWDSHWENQDLREFLINFSGDNVFIPAIKKYLIKGSLILEGGCGRGQLVCALYNLGYRVVGVDFAQRTLHKIKKVMSELDMGVGDVQKIPLASGTLDGYISVGVIEHFWNGYEETLLEACRVLRPGGYLFISFPYLSFFRTCKQYLEFYPRIESTALTTDQIEQFYQYLLRKEVVIADLQRRGFELCEKIPFDGIKGLKDEVPFFKPWLQKVYDGKYNHRLRRYLNYIIEPFTSHSIMLVMRKNEGIKKI